MRTGSSLFEVLLCTSISITMAFVILHHISPKKEKIISEFKKYTDNIDQIEYLENIKQTPNGIELLRKIYYLVSDSESIKLSEEELELLKFLSEI